MRERSIFRIVAGSLLAGVLLLASCAVVPRNATFNEGEFAKYNQPGTGAVSGRAFMELRDKTIRVAANTAVNLEPATSYTEETKVRKWVHGENLAPADARLAPYVREALTDGDGNFTFEHLSPGQYFVVCHALWREELNSADSDQPFRDHWQWLFARVDVRNGARVAIDDWNQGHFIVH